MLTFLGLRRLQQKLIDAVVDISAVSPRILLERMRVFRQPYSRLQFVLENLEIDLPVPRQLGVIHLLRQARQRVAVKLEPARARLRRDVIQRAVKAMVAQARGVSRLLAEMFLQVMLEKGLQFRIPFLRLQRQGGRGHGGDGDSDHGPVT